MIYIKILKGLRGWLHGEISARAEIPARLLTYGKEKTNLNKKHECVLKYEPFLFKLYSSFQYVNSRAEISARAEISPCNQPLTIYSRLNCVCIK